MPNWKKVITSGSSASLASLTVSGNITAAQVSGSFSGSFSGDGSQLTGLPSSGLTWISKTTTYTAAVNEGILADTSGGAFTVTLPPTPTVGSIVGFSDATSTFETNNLTIARNGSLLQGAAEDLDLDVNDLSFQLVYTGASKGWTLDTFLPATTGGQLMINSQTGTTYTLNLADSGKYLRMNNASAITLTVPTNSSAAFGIGTVITVIQVGAGVVTISGAGVTFNTIDGNSTAGQYGSLQLIKVATDTWDIIGGVT